MTDTLDSRVIFQSASFGGVHSGAGVGGVVTWTLPILRTGEERILEINAQVLGTLNDGEILTNIVVVDSDSSEPVGNLTNNRDEITTTVKSGTDLAVSKIGPAQVLAGSTLTYTISVVNNGPADAQDVFVTDTLPSTILTGTVTFANSLGATCVQTNNLIACDVGTMLNGASGVITITGQVDPAATLNTTFDNNVAASSSTVDIAPLNNSAAHQTQVVGVADLAIAKTGSTSTAVAGLTTITYTLAITNNGPSQAANVFVNDPLTTGLTLVSAVASQGVCATGVACSMGTLAVGQSETITVVATIAANVADQVTLRNVARVTGAVIDNNLLNNSDDHLVTVTSLAVLTIDKIDQFDPVAPGDPIFYRIAITNTGPSAAANVRITDTLPANVTFQSAGVDCLHDGSASGGTITCGLTSLAVGERYEFDVVALAPLDVISGTVLTNSVIAQAINSAQVSADEQTTVQQQFGPPADLAINKTGTATAVAGEQVTYTIVITNNGPAAAISPDLKDVLPAGVTLASISTSQGQCAASSLGGLCQFGNIGLNEVVTVTVVGTVGTDVAAGSNLVNTAQVFAVNPDPNPNNNTDTAGTLIDAQADLSVVKTVTPNPAVPGETVTYQIVVSNAGPSDAQGVTVNDTLPTALTGVTVSPSQGTCTTGGSCALGIVPAGGTATVTIVGTVKSDVTVGFTNNVTVGSTTTDPTPGNNNTATPSTVAPNADLSLGIISTPTSQGGTTATVTVTVQNNGPSDAVGTVVTVTLPASTTVNDINGQLPAGWTAVDNGNGTVTISADAGVSLTPGQTVDLPIVVNVASDVEPGSSLEFTAATSSDTPDATPANNSGNSDTSIIGLADLVLTKIWPDNRDRR